MQIFKNSKKNLNVVGIMSGTSLDGVDFVLISKNKDKMKFKDMSSVSYPKKLKNELMNLAEGLVNFRESQRIHFKLGEFYQKSLAKIQKQKKWKFDLIGLHGQTVFHEAPNATTQIGEPSFLKSYNVPVVSDFRSKILSVGGDGAPLAPLFHAEVLKKEKSWSFLNLGGMSNLTIKKNKTISASDYGPANVFIDGAMKELYKKDFDKDGMTALKGIPDYRYVKKYCNTHPFFKKKMPKSCGREEFSYIEFSKIMKSLKKLSGPDLIATLCEISLFPIFKELKKTKIKTLVVSGGGAKNNYFMKRLDEELRGTAVLASDEIGWPTQAVEGATFAMLAAHKVEGFSPDLSYMKIKKSLSPLGRVD